MMFSIQKYLPNLFISIVLEGGHCHLLGQVYQNKKVVNSFENTFDNPKDDIIDLKVINYIKERSKPYNGVYIAFFLNSIGQGAIAGTGVADFQRHNIDVKNINIIKVSKRWSFYSSHIDIKWARNILMPLSEVDLLYSPFALLHKCVKQEKMYENPTLYIYNHETSFAVAVFEGTNLLFGAYFTIDKPDSELEEMANESQWTQIEEDDLDNLVELEDIQLEGEPEEEYASLEEVDTLEYQDDDIHTKLQANVKNEEEPVIVKDKEASLSLFGRNMIMYNYLISAIKEFYGGSYYRKVFLEDLVIYDNHEIDKAVVNMIESELLMRVKIKKVNTLELVSDMAIKDIFK